MVAVSVEGLPQVGGNNGLADIEHGVPHLLDAMDHEHAQEIRVFREDWDGDDPRVNRKLSIGHLGFEEEVPVMAYEGNKCPQCGKSMTWGNYLIDRGDNWYCSDCELLIFEYPEDDDEEEVI